jgi:large subunit ribosomal protein L4
MNTDVFDLKNKKTGTVELDDTVFGAEVREHLFYEVINWQRARRRAGTHKIKGRAEVRGGGRKPFKQKGTGRARQGTSRAPNMPGGGVVHGPTPRDYSYAMPKKKRRAALCSALSMKVRDGQLRIVDDLTFKETKTKFALGVLDAFSARKALFVDTTTRDSGSNLVSHNESLRLSVRNLKNAKYLAAEGLNVEDLLHYETLFLSQAAAEHIQETLKS